MRSRAVLLTLTLVSSAFCLPATVAGKPAPHRTVAGPAAARKVRKPATPKKPPAPPTILSMIPKAKARLAGVPVGTRKLGGDNAVLAVWKKGGFEGVKLVRVVKGVSKTKGFEVNLVHQNWINSEYEVLKPSGYVVLAIRTNVVKRGGRRKGTEPATYAPYSRGIHTPELIAAGREYLEKLVDAAEDRLDRANVKSVFDSRYFATDTSSRDVMKVLLLIEHMDPDEFEAKGVKFMVEKVLVTVGANKGEAYRYAFSDAGAGGFAQFIPKTYAFIQKKYAGAKLKRGFIDGMRDHLNAVMAQYCLADWSVGRLPLDMAHAMAWRVREEDAGAFIAAAYNGGEDRAVQAMLNHPKDWEKPGHGLAKETVIYVREFRLVFRHLNRE